MRKPLMSVAAGAALCCGAFGYGALPSGDALTLGAWSAVVLSHAFGGFAAAGGLAAWRERALDGVAVCAALGAVWTLVQAGGALVAYRLLAPPLSSIAAGWMIVASAASMVALALCWPRTEARRPEQQLRSP